MQSVQILWSYCINFYGMDKEYVEFTAAAMSCHFLNGPFSLINTRLIFEDCRSMFFCRLDTNHLKHWRKWIWTYIIGILIVGLNSLWNCSLDTFNAVSVFRTSQLNFEIMLCNCRSCERRSMRLLLNLSRLMDPKRSNNYSV